MSRPKRSGKVSQTRTLSWARRIFVSLENCCRTPPAASAVAPRPIWSRSSTTTSVRPRSARAWAMAQPMMPAPMMTASAVVFTPFAPAWPNAATNNRSAFLLVGIMAYRPARRGRRAWDQTGGTNGRGRTYKIDEGNGGFVSRRHLSPALLRRPRADVGQYVVARSPGAEMPARSVDLPGGSVRGAAGADHRDGDLPGRECTFSGLDLRSARPR